jgi:hypothetical protein
MLVAAALWGAVQVEFSGTAHAGDWLQVKDLTPVRVHRAPQHPPVVIASNGVPRAKVYLADEHPSKNLAILLKELLDVVKLSTGAELEVVKRVPAAETPAIVIGDCEASRAAGIDAARIPVEGFVVKTATNRVYLVGSSVPLPEVKNISGPFSNDGTAWAVADFLERFVGVRWYWPIAVNGRSILKMKTLVIGPVHYSDAPVFRKREFYPRGAYPVPRGNEGARRSAEAIPAGLTNIDMTVLLAGLRMGNSYPYMIKVHDPQQIWKNQALIDAHPTMFCKKASGERNFSVLCYSSPETFDFLLAGCEAFWDQGRLKIPSWHNHWVSWVTTTSVTISPFDEPVGCYCENCRRLYDPAGGNFGTASKVMGSFVKKFAEEVKRRWPDKKVMYLPYWNYMLCPQEIDFPDNLEIQMCTEAFALLKQPKTRGMMEKNMRAWSKKVGGKIQSWEYPHRVGDWNSAPLQYPHLVQDYYRHNRELLVGSFLNGNTLADWSKTAPTLYCFMKILWNPDVDVDAVIDGMCGRMFGKAAGTVREFLQLTTDRWEKTAWSIEQQDYGKLDPPVWRETWPPEVVAKMTRLWKQADSELKDDPLARQRFHYVTWGFESFPEEANAQWSGNPDK